MLFSRIYLWLVSSIPDVHLAPWPLGRDILDLQISEDDRTLLVFRHASIEILGLSD